MQTSLENKVFSGNYPERLNSENSLGWTFEGTTNLLLGCCFWVICKTVSFQGYVLEREVLMEKVKMTKLLFLLMVSHFWNKPLISRVYKRWFRQLFSVFYCFYREADFLKFLLCYSGSHHLHIFIVHVHPSLIKYLISDVFWHSKFLDFSKVKTSHCY